ncbi:MULTISPECIES: hypothetical protein [unclassified Streptomyces]|uniref:hypothetical protein n=1 Tax=unclassified Streptomyces TaxID=2593676 RepID=UPI000D375E98|nr:MULTISPECIES: hypothetical protein [unclassified Streptomyces]PTM99477.1 hypothetical protein C7821_102424 [Streptomyces sp. VMFN-G11Ma]
MHPDDQRRPVVGERLNRSLTTGCLIALLLLVIVLVSGLAGLWYANWHADNVNSQRRAQAVSSILQQARDTADDTARSLDASHSADIDKLIGVIWKHSGSPLIRYDSSHQALTARLPKQVMYETAGVLPGAGSDAVRRCVLFTFSYLDDHVWTPKVTLQAGDACRSVTDIGYLSRLADKRIGKMDAGQLSRVQIQKALDPTGRLHTFAVKRVTRGDGKVTAAILISSHDGTAEQCYRITRSITPADENGLPSTAAPTSSSCST